MRADNSPAGAGAASADYANPKFTHVPFYAIPFSGGGADPRPAVDPKADAPKRPVVLPKVWWPERDTNPSVAPRRAVPHQSAAGHDRGPLCLII